MAQSSYGKQIGRITNQKPSITIEWKIYNYFALSQKMGKQYVSPSFNFLDAKWYLDLLPNGESNFQDWIVLYLNREISLKKMHDIHFTLGIRKSNEGTIYSWSSTCKFDDENKAWGKNIVQKIEILKNAHEIAPDKHLTVFCVLYEKDHELDSSSVYTDNEDVSGGLRDTGNPSSVPTPLTSAPEEDEIHTEKESLSHAADGFFKDMEDLLVSERLCDVKILIKSKELQAHKAILAARSSVFSAMFEHEMTEKKSNIVEILDCEFDVFKEFLHYLYTGKVQEISEINVCEIYVLADKYDVKHLKGECIAIMNRGISVDNFCDIISLAVKFKESELLKKATDYFLKNTKNILLTVNWQSFLLEAPTVANELFLKLVT